MAFPPIAQSSVLLPSNGVARWFSSTGNVSHSTSKTYCIGAYNSLFAAFVAKYHHAVVVVSFIEFKRSEVNPCTSTNFLINFKFGYSSVMEYQIFGVAYTIGECLIRNINGILACCR